MLHLFLCQTTYISKQNLRNHEVVFMFLHRVHTEVKIESCLASSEDIAKIILFDEHQYKRGFFFFLKETSLSFFSNVVLLFFCDQLIHIILHTYVAAGVW